MTNSSSHTPPTPGAGAAGLVTVDFGANGVPVQKAAYNTNVQMQAFSPAQYSGVVRLAKERFNWFRNAEQVALQIATGGGQGGSRPCVLHVPDETEFQEPASGYLCRRITFLPPASLPNPKY